VSATVTTLRRTEHSASADLAGLRARAQALAEAVSQGADASGVLLAEPRAFAGVLGPLAELLRIEDGGQDAIAAALGAASGAVAVADLDAAVAILAGLKEQDRGRAGLIVADRAGSPRTGPAGRTTAAGGQPVPRAVDLVTGPPELAAALEALLGDVLVCADLAAGLTLIRAHPGLRVVTRDGDVLGAHWAQGGSAAEQSLLSLQAAARQAADQLGAAQSRSQRAERQLAAGIEDEEQARQALTDAFAALHEADAAAAETSGKLGSLAGRARAARDETGRLSAAIAAAERSRQQSLAQVADTKARLAEQEAAQPAAEPAAGDAAEPAGRQELAEAAVAARSAEMEARLEVRTVEERLRAISGRADSLVKAAVAERQAAVRAQVRAERRAAGAAVASAVADGARVALERIAVSSAAADAERLAAEEAHKGRDGELKVVRVRIREISEELDKVIDSAHGAQMARTTRQLQLEQISGRALEEYAIEAAVLVAEYGPEVPVPGPDEGQLTVPFVREEQEKRAQAAQRKLDQLGKVNPLALEEFAALEERHAFLVAQLEDLKKTRRDLLTVIREVDERVQQVFSAAFADISGEFEHIIGRLFPGGEGRLLLTEPDDMLSTGIEVEARPPGKKVKRLSLLSGGERALTAIAFLVAIFKARPSPFYVLDEVEAALDDTNLQRLLEILAELRDVSQLIIVTHQKRTMEVADTLYGISMRGDGVSSVISQRLRERETV
jgi:chromosome segregation protein